MAISPQDLRKLERLVGRSQAAALARKIEARAQQAARRATSGTGSQQAAARTEAVIIKELVTKKRAGWVNEPGKSRAVLVEAKTGCVVLDSKGKVITGPKITLNSKPGINQNVFLQHLKTPGIELFVPYMYLDTEGKVTVGIGTLLPDAGTARRLPFVERHSGKPADKEYVAIAFENVRTSSLPHGEWLLFRRVTSIELSEANAELKALADMDNFINILSSKSYYPDYNTYPATAKMGLLDLAYNRGAKGARDDYKKTTAAKYRRDWKKAGIEQRDGRKAFRADIAQAWFNQAAQQEPFFIGDRNCRKPLTRLLK